MIDARNPWLPLIGRIFLSVIFITSGIFKIVGFSGQLAFVETSAMPFPALALVIAIILELGGGVLLALGWQTRLAAWTLILFTVVATAFFHLDLADQLQQAQFMKNLAIVGGLLYVLVLGAGRYSLDYKRSSQSASAL